MELKDERFRLCGERALRNIQANRPGSFSSYFDDLRCVASVDELPRLSFVTVSVEFSDTTHRRAISVRNRNGLMARLLELTRGRRRRSVALPTDWV